MFKIRMDWHTGPRVATLDNRGGGATVRLWLQGGSGIRHSDNIADPSAPQPSPIAILRIRQSPGMEREQNETTGGNREEAEAGLDVLNLANACSTPLKRGCQHTTEPVWNFESGFFIFDTQHATLEISVWDAAQLRRQEAARWELAEEFIQLHTHGVVARAYLGSVLVELKHFESKAGRILVQEHHLMIPRMNARFLQALRLLQAVVRRQQPEVARSVLLLRRRLGPVRRGGKISLTIAAARNLPRRRSKDLQQLPKQMRKMMTHFVSAHSGAAKPSAFVHVSALDAFSHAATLVTAAVCSRQQKERDAEARRERHDQGAFTPILLTTAHQSPGHHVYDRHEALTQAERAALTLAGRNARSRNLTPILASVQEDAQGLPEEHDTMPHHPGFRRAQMQWRASLKQQEAEAKKAAEKQRISHGYMRDDKQTTVVLSQPGTPAGGTPVSFALSTPTFKLGTPLIPPTPAKALMGVSTGTPVVENQGQKK